MSAVLLTCDGWSKSVEKLTMICQVRAHPFFGIPESLNISRHQLVQTMLVGLVRLVLDLPDRLVLRKPLDYCLGELVVDFLCEVIQVIEVLCDC